MRFVEYLWNEVIGWLDTHIKLQRKRLIPMDQRNTSNYSDSNYTKENRPGEIVRIMNNTFRECHNACVTCCVVPPSADGSYEDTHNDEPWNCSAGTRENDGIWINGSDRIGALMASMVWLLLLYSVITMIVLHRNNHVSSSATAIYSTIVALAAICHAKTCLSDPGAVPHSAVPLASAAVNIKIHTLCSKCQAYKPAKSHHCRICKRCIAGMDHHCPWMNNCIGAGKCLFMLVTSC